MVKVYLSLGSNIGDRVKNINKAVSLIKANPGINCVEQSTLYITAPQGYLKQDDFINCVLSLETNLEASELLLVCQDVEKKLKRVRLFRWGPRIIDVDILLYGDKIINTPDLTIPHPRMYERAFVLVPLGELDSTFNKYIDKVSSQDVRIYTQPQKLV